MTHLMAGRCCCALFKVTKSHHHLENAYAHYTRSIEAMTVPREVCICRYVDMLGLCLCMFRAMAVDCSVIL